MTMTRPSPGDADPYALIPELYDLEHASFADDIALYLQLAEVVGDPILELGCGSGRVLLALARAGYRLAGIDRSGPMLDRARDAVAEEGLAEQVTLVQADMTAAGTAGDRQYGLVLLALNGVMHLETSERQREVLTTARRALDPRGMLAIDTVNPDPGFLAALDGRVEHEGTWLLPDGTRVDRFGSRRHQPATQRIDTRLWYDLAGEDGQLRRVSSEFSMRHVTRAELELMLELCGFAEWQVYGSYELDPYDDGSERLIVLAEVTAGQPR